MNVDEGAPITAMRWLVHAIVRVEIGLFACLFRERSLGVRRRLVEQGAGVGYEFCEAVGEGEDAFGLAEADGVFGN